MRLNVVVLPGVLFVLMTALAGCDGAQWGRGQLATAPDQSDAASSMPANEEDAPAADPLVAVRAEEARAQVLEFINRLDDLGQDEGDATGDVESGVGEKQALVSRGSHDADRVAGNSLSEATTQTERPKSVERTVPPAIAASFVPENMSPVLARLSSRTTGAPAVAPRIIRLAVSRVSPHAHAGGGVLHVANRPLAGGQGASVEGTIDELHEQMRRSPTDMDIRWQLLLLELATSDNVSPLTYEGLAEPRANLMRGVGSLLMAAWQASDDTHTDVADVMTHVAALRESLLDQSNPVIQNVAMCSRVQAFGVYDVLPVGAFQAHRPNQAIVYFEVDRFTSEETGDGRFQTVLSERFELYTPDGKRLDWEQNQPRIEDMSRGRRRDFFIAHRITMPADMNNGDYILKITVKDLQSNRQTQAVHEFTIGYEKNAG